MWQYFLFTEMFTAVLLLSVDPPFSMTPRTQLGLYCLHEPTRNIVVRLLGLSQNLLIVFSLEGAFPLLRLMQLLLIYYRLLSLTYILETCSLTSQHGYYNYCLSSAGLLYLQEMVAIMSTLIVFQPICLHMPLMQT